MNAPKTPDTPETGYPDNNPKTAVGVSKAPLHFIPPVALVHLGLAMENGGGKYGLMNWRKHTVSASVYYDAMLRHLLEWWDGEDAASDSKVHHLGHVMACAAILLDAAETTRLNDDRPDDEGQVAYLLERVRKSRERKQAPVNEVPAPEELKELAAREAFAVPADATNDPVKHHSRLNMPKPGAPLIRRGLRLVGGEVWFEDTPLLRLDETKLQPSAQERLAELVSGIDGEPFPVPYEVAKGAEG